MLQGPRAQVDRKLYKSNMQAALSRYPNLDIRAGSVFDLVFQHSGNAGPDGTRWGKIGGVKLGEYTRFCLYTYLIGSLIWRIDSGEVISCSQVIICTGTFLGGEIHIGPKRIPAGRINEAPSIGLSASLNAAGFRLSRLQTGTPARLDARTIDFSNPIFEVQPGDPRPSPFSFMNTSVDNAVSSTDLYYGKDDLLTELLRIIKSAAIKHILHPKHIKLYAITYTARYIYKKLRKGRDTARH
jgi:tRNA uridine 5-carboxymethylaminomethyl modification enzyme